MEDFFTPHKRAIWKANIFQRPHSLTQDRKGRKLHRTFWFYRLPRHTGVVYAYPETFIENEQTWKVENI